MKDQAWGKILLPGPSKNGLYIFSTSFNKSPICPQAYIGERTSAAKCHSRLGHHAFRVVSQIISRFKFPVVSNKIDTSCSFFFNSESKQLSFSSSSTQINVPLELIYFDVWVHPLFALAMDTSIMALFWMPLFDTLGFIP